MIGLTAGFIAIVMTGLSVIKRLTTHPLQNPILLLLLAPLAILVGVGIWSVSYIGICLMIKPTAGILFIKDFILTTLSVIFLWKAPSGPGLSLLKSGRSPWMRGLFWISFILVAGVLLLHLRAMPDGMGDSWIVWNLRARFLYYEGWSLDSTFSPLLFHSHLEYPLMLPGLVAQTWQHLGSTHHLAPGILHIGIALLTLWLLVSLLKLLRGDSPSWMAGCFLLSTPYFVWLVSQQYADPLLSCFILGTGGCLALARQSPREHMRGFLMLAGLLVSMAVWTKNEGWLHFLAFTAALAFIPAFSSQNLPRFSALSTFILGALPLLVITLLFKAGMTSPASSDFNWDYSKAVSLLTDPHRWSALISHMGKYAFPFGRWNFFPILMLLLPLVLWKNHRPSLGFNLLLPTFLLLTLSGFIGVILLTRHPLTWQFDTTWDRLFFQCWPTLILSFFLWLPENSWTKKSGN